MSLYEPCKKRRLPEKDHMSQPVPKRFFTISKGGLDSSIAHSALDTVTCSLSTRNQHSSATSMGQASSDFDSSASSIGASAVPSTSRSEGSHMDDIARITTKSMHEGRCKGSLLCKLYPVQCNQFDFDGEASELTVDITQSHGCFRMQTQGPVSMSDTFLSYERSEEESGLWSSRSMKQRKDQDWKVWSLCPDGLDDKGMKRKATATSQMQVSGDTQLVTSRQMEARQDYAKMPLSEVDEIGSSCMQKANVFSSASTRLKPGRDGFYKSEQNGKGFHVSVLADVGRVVPKVLHEGHDDVGSGDINVRGGLGTDEAEGALHGSEDDVVLSHEPRLSYVLSSGRMSLEEEARLGWRAPTIDQDFEEYFSSLIL